MLSSQSERGIYQEQHIAFLDRPTLAGLSAFIVWMKADKIQFSVVPATKFSDHSKLHLKGTIIIPARIDDQSTVVTFAKLKFAILLDKVGHTIVGLDVFDRNQETKRTASRRKGVRASTSDCVSQSGLAHGKRRLSLDDGIECVLRSHHQQQSTHLQTPSLHSLA